MKSPARMHRTTIQIRSTNECQNWRKSNPRFGCSRSCSLYRAGIVAGASGRFPAAGVGSGWLITKENLLQRYYTRDAVWKRARERKSFRLKNTFCNCNSISGQDTEVFAAAARQSFRIYLEHLIAAGGLSPDTNPFGRGDAGVAASHRNRFQQIDTPRASLRHLITAGPVDLSQNRETALRVSHQHHSDFGTHQIIAGVKLGQARGGLGKSKA